MPPLLLIVPFWMTPTVTGARVLVMVFVPRSTVPPLTVSVPVPSVPVLVMASVPVFRVVPPE